MTSPVRLQREAEAARVGLADTLGQIRDGMAPTALSGEALGLVKDTGLSLLKSLTDQARANPVPALLIGAGIVMLLTRTTGGDVMSVAGSAFRSAAATGSDAARSAANATGRAMKDAASAVSGAATTTAMAASDAVVDAAQRATGAVGEKVTHLRERAGGSVAHAQEAVAKGYESARTRVQDAVDQGRQELHDREDQAGNIAHKVQDKATTMADHTRQSVARLIEEQPILMAALAAALGAAVGAMLPVSQAEKELLGETGAKALDKGREALSGAADVVRQEVASADIGARMTDIADKVIQNVTGADRISGSGQPMGSQAPRDGVKAI